MLCVYVNLSVWCGKRAGHAKDCRAQQAVENGGDECWQEQAGPEPGGVIDGPWIGAAHMHDPIGVCTTASEFHRLAETRMLRVTVLGDPLPTWVRSASR